VTIESHQTYVNLTDAFFKQRLLSIFKKCCEKGTRERRRRPNSDVLARERPKIATVGNASMSAPTQWLLQFALPQIQSRRTGSGLRMAACVFLCPHTGQRVQGWFADDASENGGETYEGVTCLACKQLHMVNPQTGKVLGADEE
jgi:hypothetical protein